MIGTMYPMKIKSTMASRIGVKEPGIRFRISSRRDNSIACERKWAVLCTLMYQSFILLMCSLTSRISWDMTLTLFLISYNIGVKKATGTLRPKLLFLLAYPKEQKDDDNGLFEGNIMGKRMVGRQKVTFKMLTAVEFLLADMLIYVVERNMALSASP